MTPKQKFALILVAIAIPLSAFAAAPSNVSSISASVQNGALTVSWSAAEDPAGIAFYRIYYSHESILENDGNYDDYEKTAGPETTYVFRNIPLNSPKIFIGVLAVNKDGIESEGFEEEASVDVSRPSSSSSSKQQSSSTPQGSAPSVSSSIASSAAVSAQGERISLTSLDTVSSTGVLLTFSKRISIDPSVDPVSFALSDTGGTVLRIYTLEVRQNSIHIETDPQVPGKLYLLSILKSIPAADKDFYAAGGSPLRVIGFGGSPVGSSSSSSSTRPAALFDPSNLRLQTVPKSDGTYSVIATWDKAPGTPQGYVLYTTQDGKQFRRNSTAGAEELSAQFSGIRSGSSFGLKVATLGTGGKESAGIVSVLTLPSTGIGLLIVTGTAAGIAGLRMRRRKAQAR